MLSGRRRHSTSTYQDPKRIALLSVVLVIVTSWTSRFTATVHAQSASGTLTFDAFKSTIFKPAAVEMVNRLEPCGCVFGPDERMPTLTASTKDATNMTTLRTAEFLLFSTLKMLLTRCYCDKGTNTTAEAIATTQHPPSLELITSAQANAMKQRVGNVVDLVLEQCCDVRTSQKSFRFVSGLMTFASATISAEQQAGTLAMIKTRAESSLAVNALLGGTSPTVSGDGGNGMYAWIGLKSDLSVGWRWINGHPLGQETSNNFVNWGTHRSGDNLCGAISLNSWNGGVRGQWNALPCSTELPYLLETQATRPTSAPKKRDYKEVTIIIVVLLCLFLLASIAVIVRKVLDPLFGDKHQHPTRRRVRTIRRTNSHNSSGSDPNEGEGEEMTAIGSQHRPRQVTRVNSAANNRSRRVHFPQGGGSNPQNVSRRSQFPPRDEDGRAAQQTSSGVRRQNIPATNPAISATKTPLQQGRMAPTRNGKNPVPATTTTTTQKPNPRLNLDEVLNGQQDAVVRHDSGNSSVLSATSGPPPPTSNSSKRPMAVGVRPLTSSATPIHSPPRNTKTFHIDPASLGSPPSPLSGSAKQVLRLNSPEGDANQPSLMEDASSHSMMTPHDSFAEKKELASQPLDSSALKSPEGSFLDDIPPAVTVTSPDRGSNESSK